MYDIIWMPIKYMIKAVTQNGVFGYTRWNGTRCRMKVCKVVK